MSHSLMSCNCASFCNQRSYAIHTFILTSHFFEVLLNSNPLLHKHVGPSGSSWHLLSQARSSHELPFEPHNPPSSLLSKQSERPSHTLSAVMHSSPDLQRNLPPARSQWQLCSSLPSPQSSVPSQTHEWLDKHFLLSQRNPAQVVWSFWRLLRAHFSEFYSHFFRHTIPALHLGRRNNG